MTKKGKNGENTRMRFTLKSVTVEQAKKWLSKNESNRRPSNTRIADYHRTMQRGEWKGELCPQPIVIDSEGHLLDGQHRLMALVQYGRPLDFHICSGGPAACRRYVDKVRIRTAADTLTMEYNEPQARMKLAACRYVQMLATGDDRPLNDGDFLEMKKNTHQKEIEWLSSIEKSRQFSGAFLLGPLAWVSRKYPKEVSAFYEDVKSGAGLGVNSPQLRLRDTILTSETAGGQNGRLLALKTLSAFYAYLNNRSIRSLKIGRDGYVALRKELRVPSEAERWVDRTMEYAKRRRGDKRRDDLASN